MNGFGHGIYDDMRFFLKADCRPVKAHTCSEGIRIGNLMSHDHDLVLRDNELSECLCLDTGFHAGILGGLLLLSAEICDTVAVLDNCLVAPSCQRQIDRHTRILIAQRIGRRVQSETDTKCSGPGISDIDLLNLLKKRKLIFSDFLVTLFSQYDEVFILLHLLNDAVHIVDVFIDLPVDQRDEK